MSRCIRMIVGGAVAAAAVVPIVAMSPAQPVEAATTSVFCDDRPATDAPVDARLDGYQPITPRRLVDTRDGTGGVEAPIEDGCTLQVDLSSSMVPPETVAVALSLTSVSQERGFLSVSPCESGRRPTSNVNSRPGVASANLVAAMLDSADRICIYSNHETDVVVDLVGWWGPDGGRYGAIDPERAYDTRELPDGGQRLPAGHVRNVPVTDGAVPDDAIAAVVNLTVAQPSGRGWLLASPCGEPLPLASNLNFLGGEARAVAAIVGLGAGPAQGQLCITSNVDVHFIVDVVGYYLPDEFGPFAALEPSPGTRLVDTRDDDGPWRRPFDAGETRMINPVAGHPDEDVAAAVLLNVTSTGGTGRGHLRVFPCEQGSTATSAVNFEGATAAANLVPIDLDDDREVCVFASEQVDVVIDLFGVMTAPDGSLAERMSPEGMETWPDFHVEGTDYGIVCSAGVNRFDLELVPLPGATAMVDGVVVEAGPHSLAVRPDELTIVTFERGSQQHDYHFRCLPVDFPVLDVDRPGDPAPGWYLTQFGQGSATVGPYLAILDEYGAAVWYKRAEQALLAAVRRDDGTIGASNAGRFYGTTDDDVSRRTYELDGTLLDVRRPPDPENFPADHHDFVDIPGGGGAYLSYPLREHVDLTALGPEFSDDELVLDGAIIEVDAAGIETWAWNSADHFLDEESTYPTRWFRSDPDDGEVDLVHPNSLQRLDDGDYVVSARHYDAAFRVDYPSGDVRWVLGGTEPTATAGAPRLTVVDDPYGGPLRPHDARLNGDVLTLFDNRSDNGAGEPARAVAYRIDTSAMTATMLWQIERGDGGASPAQGSARVTPDGSVLVSWATQQPVFEEFTPSGETMMSIAEVPGGNSYRIIKYEPGDFDVDELRATAGGALGAPPPLP